MGRLIRYVRSYPRRSAAVVATFIAILIVALVVVDAYLLKPEYLSEDTPLSLVEGGIMWTAEHNDSGLLHSTFEFLRFSLSAGSDDFAAWPLEYYPVNNGSVTVIDFGPKTYGNLNFSLNLTDLTGNGIFDQGDSLTLTASSSPAFEEDRTYRLSLSFSNPILFFHKDYSFVVHDCHLRAWDSTPFQYVY